MLWLEETTLNKIINLQHQEFPPQFDLNRLAMIFSNNTVYWSEFIPLHDIRQKQIEENNSWQRICYRYVAPERHSVISLRASKEIDPKGKKEKNIIINFGFAKQFNNFPHYSF